MNLIIGASYLLHGFRLIFKPGIRRYVAIPLVINTILFSILIWFATHRFNIFIDWLIPGWLDWMEWLIWPIFAVSVLIILFFCFTLVANFIAAPFNGLLAEAVELHLTGKRPGSAGGLKELMVGLAGSMVSEVKKILYFLSRSIPLWILFFIPLINLAAPFLLLAFNAWMLSLQFMDYPMGNHGLIHSRQRAITKERPLMMLGFGGTTMLLLMIPVVNFLAMPTAVAGATTLWVREFSGSHSTV